MVAGDIEKIVDKHRADPVTSSDAKGRLREAGVKSDNELLSVRILLRVLYHIVSINFDPRLSDHDKVQAIGAVFDKHAHYLPDKLKTVPRFAGIKRIRSYRNKSKTDMKLMARLYDMARMRREPQTNVEFRFYVIRKTDMHGRPVYHRQVEEELVCLSQDIYIVLPKPWFSAWEDDMIELESGRWDLIKSYDSDAFEVIDELANSLDKCWIRMHGAADVRESTYSPSKARNGLQANSGALNSPLTTNRIEQKGTTFSKLLKDPAATELREYIVQQPDACAWDVTLLFLKRQLAKKGPEVEKMMRAAVGTFQDVPEWNCLFAQKMSYPRNKSCTDRTTPGMNKSLLASLDDMLPVWNAFNMTIVVLDIALYPRWQWHATARKERKCDKLFIMQKDDHLRFIDLSVHQVKNMLEKVMLPNGSQQYVKKPTSFLKPGERWNFFRPARTDHYQVVETIDDLCAVAKQLDSKVNSVTAYYKETTVKNLLFEAWPFHQAQNVDGQCKQIRFAYENGIVDVKAFPRGPADKNYTFKNAKTLQQALKWQHRLNTELFQRKFMSRYPVLVQCLRYFSKQAYRRRLLPARDRTTHAAGLDKVKHYLSVLLQMKYLPVFTDLDEWEAIDEVDEGGMELEDYNLYCVNVREPTSTDVYLDRASDLCTGAALKRCHRWRYEIVAVLRPAQLVPNPIITSLEQLFTEETVLSLDDIKELPNVLIGCLGKLVNRRNHVHTFVNQEEARYMRAFLEKPSEVMELWPEKDDDRSQVLYYLEQSFERDLVEGFYAIKFYLLD